MEHYYSGICANNNQWAGASREVLLTCTSASSSLLTWLPYLDVSIIEKKTKGSWSVIKNQHYSLRMVISFIGPHLPYTLNNITLSWILTKVLSYFPLPQCPWVYLLDSWVKLSLAISSFQCTWVKTSGRVPLITVTSYNTRAWSRHSSPPFLRHLVSIPILP